VFKRILTVLAAGLLLAACAPAAPPALVRKEVKATAAVDPATPCSGKPPAAGAAPESTTAVVTFDRGANKILLTGGEHVTLPELSKAVGVPAAVRELTPGEWLLGASVEIMPGASLDVAAPDVRWLKLTSNKGPAFVSIKALGGGLDVTGTCITSWDTTTKKVDEDYNDGRSFLLARDNATMNIDYSELHFLGFGSGESYGLAWRLGRTTGKIAHSVVSDLYFGMYSYQVSGLEITDNEFFHNAVYGIDPHTSSKDLKIQRNVVHDNGKHGIILAENCTNSVITDNVVYNNGHHGIVLYLHSDSNTVENNESFGNQAQGLNINEASSNTVRNNRMYNNLESGVGIGQGANENVIEKNDIRNNQQDGVRLFTDATSTTVTDNIIGQNGRYGVYVDSDSPFQLTGNTIFGSRVGVLLKGAATASEGSNQMYGNDQANIKTGG
jgi:parallel beta-helix repeat protein